MKYECYKCNWSTHIKTKIVSHLARTRPCKNINNFNLDNNAKLKILEGFSFEEYKKTIKSPLNNITLDECKKYILEGLTFEEYNKRINNTESSLNHCESSLNHGESSLNHGESSLNPGESSLNPGESSLNPGENNNYSSDLSDESSEILRNKKDELICKYCKKTFLRKDYLENHLKKSCKMLKEFNNIYEFDKNTFGKNIYKNYENAGDIYIVQTDYINNDHFKIGISNNVQKRLSSYRCGNTYEPRLHYYISCQDIIAIDNVIKTQLVKHNIKREIFKGDVEDLKNIIIKVVKDKFKINEVHVHEPKIKICDLSECRHCNKCFYNTKDLFIHFNSCEEYKDILNKTKTLKCKNCDKIYAHKQSLFKHYKTCKEKKIDDDIKDTTNK